MLPTGPITGYQFGVISYLILQVRGDLMSYWRNITKAKWISPKRLVGTGLIAVLVTTLLMYNLDSAVAVAYTAAATTATPAGSVTNPNNIFTANAIRARFTFNAVSSLTVSGFPGTAPAGAKDSTIDSVVVNWVTSTTLSGGTAGNDQIFLEYLRYAGDTWASDGATYTTTTRPGTKTVTLTTKDGTNPWTWADLADIQMRIRSVL